MLFLYPVFASILYKSEGIAITLHILKLYRNIYIYLNFFVFNLL
jgi:hypothetical protein